MPKLKELSVQGFKSFAEPLTLMFPTGITAIVGPNGSGKSNVADAIRWVLGEQRMRTLRGRTGEDMIFAGSKRRSRAGMARVTLVFDNTDGWLPVDFSEVTIERRTYRDGKTDYLLNGSRVRLRDLQDMLDRGGLGRDAYLTIGQGLVDQVLSLRPTERLALFEQAAGIAPYRNRREQAIGQLDETQRNLERVHDIIGEIEPRLRRLERQVERAEQHAQLTAELKSQLRIWYGYRWGQVLGRLESARQRVHYHEERVAQHQEKLDGSSREALSLRRALSQARARLTDLHREGSARHAEAERFQRELAVARERRRSLQEQQEQVRANLVPLHTTFEAEQAEIARLQGAVEQAAVQLREAQAGLAAVERQYRTLEDRRLVLLSRQGTAQSRALEVRHQWVDRVSRLEQLDEREARAGEHVAQLKTTLNSLQERRRVQQAEVEHARRDLEDVEAALGELAAEEARAQSAFDAARQASEQLREQLAAKQTAYQQDAARLHALERLHADGAGLFEGVRAVLQAAHQGALRGLPGTISSLIHVPPDLDRAISTALGSQLQNVVAERWEDAQAAIRWLKHNRAGRATFLPLDNLRPPRLLELPSIPGVIGVAAELVAYDDAALSPAVRLLLGRAAVVADLPSARALHRELRGGYQIVTLEGEILRSGGALTGGNDHRGRDGNDLLARERERRELPEKVAAAVQEVQTAQAALDDAESKARKTSQQLRDLTDQHRDLERRRQSANRRLEKEIGALEQLLQEFQWQTQRLAETGEETGRLQETRERLTRERQEAETQLAEIEHSQGEIAAALEALEEDQTVQRVSEQRTRVALMEKEHQNQRVLLETRQRERQRLQTQITVQERRLDALTVELTTLETRLSEMQQAYESARASADVLSDQIPELESQVAEMERQQEQLESGEANLRRILREVEQRRSQAEIEARRREDQVQSLRKDIEEALEIVIADLPETLSAQQPLPLSSIAASLPKVVELPEGLEQQIRDLRTQIRRLEPVNTAAQLEYDEVAERHGFLREQAEDLRTASGHLRKIIAELDEMMETAFNTTFKAIASEFSRVFKLLFNGGAAALTLETNGGSEITGVEITARPPGKRTSGLGMLSGGERTLTAVALLFAVMHVSPTPFSVLDEVDAMLDEANVGRFRAMLRELGRHTQFLIITHNRGTVEVADTIYGVSMGDDGVSQVLSLSLEDLPPSEVI